jgi:hypothetical protein
MKLSMTGKEKGDILTGNCLIELTAWADLTIYNNGDLLLQV